MRVILEIQTGASAGNKIRLKPGQLVRLGRTSKADLAFPEDSHMSGVHCVVECDEGGCRIRDLNSSNGTLVNGKKVGVATLQDGDQIVAGETRFSFRTEMEKVQKPPLPVSEPDAAGAPLEGFTPAERLLALLRKDFQPLYAILDAARSPDIYKLLVECREKGKKPAGKAAPDTKAPPKPGPPGAGTLEGGAQYESLFEGKSKADLTLFAPYLVRLLPESKLLEKLVSKGWGKSWGVLVTCQEEFKEVRRHFRHFLMVKLPDGKQVYFRFYDPRVLRVYLPTCLSEEFNQFFGPVKYYLMEDEKRDVLLRFSNAGRGVGRKALALSAPAAGPSS